MGGFSLLMASPHTASLHSSCTQPLPRPARILRICCMQLPRKHTRIDRRCFPPRRFWLLTVMRCMRYQNSSLHEADQFLDLIFDLIRHCTQTKLAREFIACHSASDSTDIATHSVAIISRALSELRELPLRAIP